MHVIIKYIKNDFVRSFVIPARLLSNEANMDSKSKNLNSLPSALPEKDNIFYHKKAQVNANIKGNQFSFEFQTSAKMTHDFWQLLFHFIEALSQRNKLQEAREKVAELAFQLHIARQAKNRIDDELAKFRKSLMRLYLENREEMPPDSASVVLRNEGDMQISESRLSALLKNALAAERVVHNDLMDAINNSYELEKAHSRFLKASIFIGIITTFIFTIVASYIYNLNSHREIYRTAERVKEHNEKLVEPSTNKGWGSYIKDYLRPIYSWAAPKN